MRMGAMTTTTFTLQMNNLIVWSSDNIVAHSVARASCAASGYGGVEAQTQTNKNAIPKGKKVFNECECIIEL